MGRVICSYGVKILFLLCISFVAYEAFMDGADGKADKLVMGLVITLSLAVLLLTRFWVRRHLQFFEKHFVKILAGYLLVLFVVQILCGIHLRYEPMWDLDSVYGGAISWLKYGNIDSYKDYFYYFPNNLGLLIFFRAYFGLLYLFLGNGMDYADHFPFQCCLDCKKAAGDGVRCCYDGTVALVPAVIFCCSCVLYRCDVHGSPAVSIPSLSVFQGRGILEGKAPNICGDGSSSGNWDGNKIYGCNYCNCGCARDAP